MSTNSYWLSYDVRDNRRRPRRKWPWFLLLVLLITVVVALAMLGSSDESVDLTEPTTIEKTLPALLTDNVTVVYVVDDSDSMWNKLLPLHQALHEVANKHTENSEVAVMLFGGSHELLFDLTEPSRADWDSAIPSFTATSGRTNLYQALIVALDTLPIRPTCSENRRWFVFKETVCRERRIVLMSDGQASDPHMAEDAMSVLVPSGISVDAVAFGEDADRNGLRNIADATGGRFVTAY